MRVLVTGASGYVGGAVVEALRRVGADAAALARPTSRVDDLRARGVPVRIAAFDDAAALDAALEGVHSVVHCAGGGRVTRRAELATNNASTTSALADAIERSDSVKRLVLVSSVAARGPTTPSAAATPEPLTEYGRAKRLAEVRCASLAASGRSVRIARPPGVYGPGDDRMLPLFRAARRGWVPVPAAAGAASFVFIDDCADALAILAVAPEADGPDAPVVLEVAHAEPIPAAEAARRIGTAVRGRPIRIVPVPTWVLRAAASGAEVAALARGATSVFNRDKVVDLTQPSWVCDPSQLEAMFGWSAKVGFDEGVARAASDYRLRGWL
ncbi:MAG: NAD-dependent epimerase/dehydratase family protein [Myxococcales bacterium]|nr:NAD-dependent epimerase/dehydratase family protein [Myxococcales bacterium]MCB9531555.1 NAD-dependent epimerase/dehydratase family protein [Myxococcales bacterium]MCB9532794.1 NAD-dependent epimerase/dehydratase family protein [Myxococcales bacterium]